MIRDARPDDIPRLVEMGRRFIAETPYKKHLDENPEKMRELAEKLMAGDGGVLVAERNGNVIAMLGYIVFEHFISGEKVAGEVCWWVEPEARGEGLKLLREVEKRAKAKGAKRMQMIAPNDRVAGLYQRLKYEFTESSYQRTL